MKKKNLFLILFLVLGTMPKLQAQPEETIKGPGPVIIISEQGQDGKSELVNIFQQTQQDPYFHDPKAPRFLFVDKQHRWGLGVGGYVQTKVEYDFGGICNNVDFYPSQLENNGPIKNQYQMDASVANIFLKLVGRSQTLGDFIIFTDANWRGNSGTLKWRNAYISFMGFLAGYSTGIFMDLAACPPTIDFADPCGMTFYRAVQLRYTHELGHGLSWCVGIERPVVGATTDSYTSVSSQRMPDIPAYLQYAWGKGQDSHIRLGGIWKNMTYIDEVSDKAENVAGWGLQGSVIAHLGPKIQCFGQYTYGRGIGEQLNDISNVNADLIYNPETNGKMTALYMQGWYAGLQYTFTPQIFGSATYSQTTLWSQKGIAQSIPDQYHRGQYIVANIFYKLSSNMQLGIEYLYGWKKDFGGDIAHANRANLSVQYNF